MGFQIYEGFEDGVSDLWGIYGGYLLNDPRPHLRRQKPSTLGSLEKEAFIRL